MDPAEASASGRCRQRPAATALGGCLPLPVPSRPPVSHPGQVAHRPQCKTQRPAQGMGRIERTTTERNVAMRLATVQSCRILKLRSRSYYFASYRRPCRPFRSGHCSLTSHAASCLTGLVIFDMAVRPYIKAPPSGPLGALAAYAPAANMAGHRARYGTSESTAGGPMAKLDQRARRVLGLFAPRR